MEQFSYLWDGIDPNWALLRLSKEGEIKLAECSIVNTKTRSALLISDNALFERVKKKMLDSNVKVVTIGDGF